MQKYCPFRSHACVVIRDALKAGRACGLEGNALEKYVSEAYPFGAPQNRAYEIWCDEFNRLVRNQPANPRRPIGLKLLGEWPGLTPEKRALFEEP